MFEWVGSWLNWQMGCAMTNASWKRVTVEELIFEIAKVHSQQLLLSWDELLGDSSFALSLEKLEGVMQASKLATDEDIRQMLAVAIAKEGLMESRVPAIEPRVMMLIGSGEVKVRHTRTGLPFLNLSEVKRAPEAWYLSQEDAGKIKVALLTDRQREIIDFKVQHGRYTLKEAAECISEYLDITSAEILIKLTDAAATKILPMYLPGTGDRCDYSMEASLEVRNYYEEAFWSDLNQWLKKYAPKVVFRFSDPKGVKTRIQDQGVSKQEIVSVEWGLPGGRNIQSFLDERPVWVRSALVDKGSPGGRADRSSRWNPAILAICLFETTPHKPWYVDIATLTKVLEGSYPKFVEQWKDAVAGIDSGC